MYHFRKMVECARRYGVNFGDAGPNDRNFLRPLAEGPMERFWNDIERCEIFCFQPTGALPKEAEVDFPDGELINEENKSYLFPEMDAPFQVFSVEMLGEDSCLTSPRGEDELHIWIYCCMAVEMEPRKFYYYVYSHTLNLKTGLRHEKVLCTNAMGPIMNAMLERLRVEKDGIKHVRETIKLGTGQTKRIRRVRRIIYVSPKRGIANLNQTVGGAVDWSHRWSVRGHWRDLANGGLGKDRSGEYSVNGMTWVNEHAKGPEEKETIHKVRLVRQANN